MICDGSGDTSVELNHVVEWCSNNYILINERMTKIIHIASKKIKIPPNVIINGKKERLSILINSLGDFLDDDLKKSTHTYSIYCVLIHIFYYYVY